MSSIARKLGVPFEGTPGPLNAITDVQNVTVGHTTLISGEGPLEVGKGPIRTGVTAILPRGRTFDPVFASFYALNGNGEMTGISWIQEGGFLESPIFLTNTHSVGIVHDAAIKWIHKNRYYEEIFPGVFWALPVVAETYDGRLNDVNGFHVKEEHVFAALEAAASGPVVEGCVGGGTGMICYQYKGGIGSASRTLEVMGNTYTVGALVQSNYGKRSDLLISGVPVGRELNDLLPELNSLSSHVESGSVVVIIATDAPFLPFQLNRLVRRVPLGIAHMGGIGAHGSGDIFLAFSTANPTAADRTKIATLTMLPNEEMNLFFDAVIQVTEESILNSMLAAHTMTGINNNKVYALPHERLVELLQKYNRYQPYG